MVSPNTIIDLWADLHHQKQESWLPVLSGSMIPLLQIGDDVLVQSVSPNSIRPGNIIVFKSRDKLIVHRVIRRYDNGSPAFLQKGDSTTTAEIIRGEDVIGKVIAVRKGSRIIRLNDGIWKVINCALTLFSSSVYHLNPENPFLKKIAKFFFQRTRSLFNHLTQKLS
ncbi:MAG: signal peptidase I [Candidatus Methanogaster sp.]|uniref:Signal peptidase I n=1 Tax=Candidatus Methanogaster sp. TaxID=3386292 RepID=A0AC61L5D6_9EURY|nr:MAG: signal peptidase I [ANME-2 cluster archaeon]